MMCLCSSASGEMRLAAPTRSYENTPPWCKLLHRGVGKAFSSDEPNAIAHRLVRLRLVAKPDKTVPIALDLKALDPPVQHNHIGACCDAKVEFLNDARVWVFGMQPGDAATKSAADILIEHGIEATEGLRNYAD